MTLRELIKRYRTDPLSRWHRLRYQVRINHRNLLRQIVRRYGGTRLKKINARTLLRWHLEWLDGTKFSAAHAFIKKLRAVFGFGLTILENRHCARIRQAMAALRFPGSPKRKQRITAEQAIAVRKAAHRRGWHSIALAQAFQFENMFRQKDVIGEWLPMEEPGEAYIIEAGEKWLRGLLFEEIDADLVIRHKTVRPGKIAVFDLRLAPMVMEELKPLRRLPESGPVIVSEFTGLPFRAPEFRRKWRLCARDAGVPDNVFI